MGDCVKEGSIPACAGEPSRSSLHNWVQTVYPRVCGGTMIALCPRCHERGLSPRVRGNQCTPPAGPAIVRSIPACAGEPFPPMSNGSTRTVYPRVCGGTNDRMLAYLWRAGLSPRVRGNQRPDAGLPLAGRSIPACAGEPTLRFKPRRRAGVYPRVCGGTSIIRNVICSIRGLSPRVRGNPLAN